MSRTWVILAAIVVAGLGVRLAYLASDPYDARAESVESEVARNLLAGRGFTVNEAALAYNSELKYRRRRLVDPATVNYAPLDKHGNWQPEIDEPVGLALLIAGVWEITGREYYLPVQILQAIVDALCALLIFRISMRLFKRRGAALVAAALYAAYFPVAWQTTIVFNDLWAVDFTIAIVACYLEAINSSHHWRWLLVCGLIAGAGIYVRPTLVFLPTILALATLPSVGWRRTLSRALVPTAIVLALLVPWTIRNYRDFHMLIFVRGALGSTMWAGLGEYHNSLAAISSYTEVHRVRPDLRFETPAWDGYLLKHFVIPAIEHHPFLYVENVGRRILRSTLLDYEGTWMHGVTLPHGRSPAAYAAFAVDHPFALLQDAFQPLVVLLAALSMGLTWRRWRRQHIFLLAVLLAVLVPYILIYLESRYILPAACVYVIWIGLGIDLLSVRVQAALRMRRAHAPTMAR